MNPKKLMGAMAMTGALAAGGMVGATLGNPLTSGAQTTTTATVDPSTTTPDQGGDDTAVRPAPPWRGMKLDAAADVLDMTVEELRTEVKDGKTLAEIAEEKGVDKQDLIDALVTAGEAQLEEAKATLPDRMAELVDAKLERPRGPGRGHGSMHDGEDAPAEGSN